MGQEILRDILIIFAVSIPVVLVAHRLKFPSIVGFLLTGFIIGPNSLGLIPDVEEIRVLAEVGVALLLFSIGLEFSFERLKGLGKTSAGAGGVQVIITIMAGVIAGTVPGWSFKESVFLGCAMALSSTAIVLAVLSHKRWFDAPAGRLVTGILIFQDLAVIPMVVLIKFLAMREFGEASAGIALAAVKLVALSIALFVLSRWIVGPFLRHTALMRSKELFVIVVVGFAIAAAYATEKMGFSFALGAFLAGFVVSTTDFRFHALSEIAPFRHCFNGLFFVTVGMIVDPLFIGNHCAEVSLLVVFIIIAKALITGGSIFAFGYPVSIAVIGALMLAQVGEFSFMLVFYGWKAGAISHDFYQLIVDAAAITMVVAPFFVAFAPALGERLAFITWRFKRFRGRMQEIAPDEEGRPADHAIICGFGPLGMTIGKLLEKRAIPYVVLELNPMTVDRIKKDVKHAYVGDGASSALLHHVNIGQAKLLAIAVPDQLNAIAIIKQARQMNPDIYIITRSRYRDQVESFYDAGADIVICEELEAGIEMGRYILSELGVVDSEISRLFKEIRSFGSADFF